MTRIEKEQTRISSVSQTLESSQCKYRSLLSKLILVMLFVVNPLWAADAKYREVKTLELQKVFGTKQPWKVTAYQDVNINEYTMNGDSEYDKSGPLKLCFWYRLKEKNTQCHLITTENYKYLTVHLMATETIVANKIAPKAGLVLISKLPFVSDALYYVSVWTYNVKKGIFENSLPSSILYTRRGDFKLFSNLQGFGVVVGAWSLVPDLSEILSKKSLEGRQYRISVYRYQNTRYQEIGEYVTAARYQDPDDPSDAWVIATELPIIRKFIVEKTLPKQIPLGGKHGYAR